MNGDQDQDQDPEPAPDDGSTRWRRLKLLAAVALPVITVAAVAIPFLANRGERESSTDTIEIRTPDAEDPTDEPVAGGEAAGEDDDAPDDVVTDDAVTDDAVMGGEAAEEDDATADLDVIGDVDYGSWWDYLTDPRSVYGWRIPVNAPFETFPSHDEAAAFLGDDLLPSCSREQAVWLVEHGQVPLSDSHSITIRNDATTGGALTLANIRFEGEEVETAAWVWLTCPSPPRGNGGRPQPMLIDVTGDEAVHGEPMYIDGIPMDEDPKPEGSPVTINLQPGEVMEVSLERSPNVDQQRAYRGVFLADVVGTEPVETVVLAEDVEFHRSSVPGYGVVQIAEEGDWLLPSAPTGSLVCQRPVVPEVLTEWGAPESEGTVCSPAEAAALLREAAESVS